MKKLWFMIFILIGCKTSKINNEDFVFYLTTPDRIYELSKQNIQSNLIGQQEIKVNPSIKYQSVDGYGATLTGGSAWAINQKINQENKQKLIEELFGNALGLSYLRVSIGASDMNAYPYTYDDIPNGETDLSLLKFTIEEDKKDIIPILKLILKANPNIKILGSPWTAPKWMKSNNSFIGGSLKPEYYQVYSEYLVKFIQEYAKEGIILDAITVQNEPENPKNNPSMVMTTDEQRDFIKNNLGPAFEKNNIKTKIIIFDHNCDHPEYPINILNDSDAKKYIDGSAFHLYAGDISAMSKTHEAHPDKNVYFTEQWNWTKGQFAGDLAWGIKNLVVGASRNWSKTVLQWNLASDQNFEPHTDHGGCGECLPMVTILDDGSVKRNVAYYTIGHISKFVPPNSVRIQSSEPANNVYNVAFLGPDGKKIMVLLNENPMEKSISIVDLNKTYSVKLASGSVATLIW